MDRREALYDEASKNFCGALERLARAYELDAERRRDLLQEIYLALWRSLERFDGRCSLRNLVRRGAPRSPALAEDGATFLREELVRQRDLLRSVRSWYLGPLVPGFCVLTLERIIHGRARGTPYAAIAVDVAVLVLVFVSVDWLNRRGARQLQREIEELDASLR